MALTKVPALQSHFVRTAVGADVMKPLAAPMLGGLITSTIHVLVVTPGLFSYMKERALRKGKLRMSQMSNWMKS